MKKFFALCSAAALLGFSACSESDTNGPAATGGNTGEVVKTQFSIALPQRIGTRMDGTTVQESGNFRGMTNIRLIPFGSAVTTGTETPNGVMFTLSDITTFDVASSKTKVYADVAMPLGTTNMLFYGQATNATSDDFANGTLTVGGLTSGATFTDPTQVTFTPTAICTSAAECGGSTAGQALVSLLTSVAQAHADVNGVDVKWKDVTTGQNKLLYDQYQKFITLTTGSTYNVQATLEDLYFSLGSLASGATPSDYKPVAEEIRSRIAAGGTINDATKTLTLTAATYGGYPADINLPDGAVRVAFVSTGDGSFTAATDMTYGTGLNVPTLGTYAYPANLWYTANSSILVSKDQQSTKPAFTGASTWADIKALYTDGTTVAANTRSVAISDEIDYGVGRLDSKVKLANTNMYDHAGNIVDITNGFTLTGILVGGQKQVGWDFTRTAPGATLDGTTYTLYDKTIPFATAIKTTAPSDAVYTLALETAADASVYVALEFVNNGEDFEGASGIIPAGGTFYLTAELKPSAGTGYAAGTLDKVFLKDYKTEATFTIAAGTSGAVNTTGLGAATNYIPDLRAPEVELALSVNLTWQAGLQFEAEL
ncbi:MAG: hypothetical protein IJ680_06375 [Paludibacteraceae bacterium]|nr:hypothetical protein [Paludibacteraceae bacterium]